MDTELIYCSGCNEVMQYDKYLLHLTENYCTINKNDYNDGNDADDENELETIFNNNYSIDLDNPMIDRGFHITNLINQFDNISLSSLEINSTLYNINTIKECYICLETYNINSPFYWLKCNHEFCKQCCEKWFKISCICPLCGVKL